METDRNVYRPGSVSPEGQSFKQQAKNKAEQARHQVRSFADSGREQVAGQIGGVAQAMRRVSGQLREENKTEAGYYTDLIGEQADRLSRYLNEHDASALVGEVEHFARRNPLMFLGGCVAAGFVFGRFFKASPPEPEGEMPLGVSGETDTSVRYTPMGTTPPIAETTPSVITTETHSIGVEPFPPFVPPPGGRTGGST